MGGGIGLIGLTPALPIWPQPHQRRLDHHQRIDPMARPPSPWLAAPCWSCSRFSPPTAMSTSQASEPFRILTCRCTHPLTPTQPSH